MKSTIIESVANILIELGLAEAGEREAIVSKVKLERPADMANGDFATNVAMMFGPKAKKSPLALAIEIVEKLKVVQSAPQTALAGIEKIEVAGPGFINFYLADSIYKKNVADVIDAGDAYGSNKSEEGKKIAFEYTDPNPFKVFHIGHLMANTAGESLSRLGEVSGAEIKRFCYQGDVGRHIALTMWGLRLMDAGIPEESETISNKVAYLGQAYALGATRYKKLEEEKSPEFAEMDAEVREFNRKIYDRSDEVVNEIYDKGKEWSLQHFEELYDILGTKFDRYFFESQTAPKGIEVVKANTAPHGAGVFEVSNGATIFAGEKYGLHTRVFLNKDGLPTYDGKEIGLIPMKYEVYNYDLGVYVTANEQDEYFKVVLKAASFIFPEIVAKTKHVSHGMLRLTTGKMSSRTGDVITGESLLHDMIEQSLEKMKEREMNEEDKKAAAQMVAVAAIKYTVLRQALGKDVIFDPQKSLSFEGDSGPYLQYSCVRANSILRKAAEAGISPDANAADASTSDAEAASAGTSKDAVSADAHMAKLERCLERYPEVVERSWKDLAPHHVANYLMDLAGTFNSFYANTQIVKADDAASPYRVALVKAFSIVMKNGLTALGIRIPSKM